jgi:beta-lactamase class D
MRETVRRGSARKGFRGFFRGEFENVEVGGKTGSLTGTSPKGRNDWFVGYASLDERKIAFASLTVNEERWTVKSAFVARKVIEAYFRSEE